MRKVFLLLALLIASLRASAVVRYVAQTAGTFTGGSACNGQTAITMGTWNTTTLSPGDITYICGTITAASGGTNGLSFHNGGSSGSPIQLIFDTGAVLSSPHWGTSSTSLPTGGAITSQYSNILIDGGTNGIIQNTLAGSPGMVATFTNGSSTIAASNSFTVDQPVQFTTTGTLPTNFSTGTTYYVTSTATAVAPNPPASFTVAAAPGGTPIIAASAGTGTQSVVIMCSAGPCTYNGATGAIYLSGGLANVEIRNLTTKMIYWCGGASVCENGAGIFSTSIKTVGNQTNLHIHNNSFGDAGVGTLIAFDGASLSGIEIDHNTIRGPYWGVDISSGATPNSVSNVNIHDNNIYGELPWFGDYNEGGAAAGAVGAGVIVSSEPPAQLFSIYNNYVDERGAATGGAFCTYDGTNTPGAQCTIFNNVFVSNADGQMCSSALWLQNGTANHSVMNNTIISTGSCFAFSDYGDNPSTYRLNNNIVSGTTTTATNTGTAGLTGVDYNLWNPTGANVWYYNGSYRTFAQWQSFGYDPNGASGNPNLDANYKPQSTSTLVIGKGTSFYSLCSGLPIPGLGALCYDKNGNPRSATATWDLGAYNYSTTLASSTFTATLNNGDWQNPLTWGKPSTAVGCHVAYPCMTDAAGAGDWVVIPSGGLTVICGKTVQEICSAGNSPNGQTPLAISLTGTSGGLQVSNGSTLIYAGAVSATDNTTLTLDAGTTVQYDSSWCATGTTGCVATTARYTFKWGSSSAGGIWAANGTFGSHVTWQGDSTHSPNYYPAASSGANPCTPSSSTTIATCDAGAINFVSGTNCPTNIGRGSLSYMDFHDVAGSLSQSTYVAWCGSFGSTANLNMAWNNVTWDNSGTVKLLVASSTDNSTIAVSGVQFTHCQAQAPTDGCFKFGGTSTTRGAGTYSITGLVTDGRLNTNSAANDGNFTFRNALMWFGAFPPCLTFTGTGGGCGTVGFLTTDGALTYDQMFIYHNAWSTGTGSPLGWWYTISPLNMSNSVIWRSLQVLIPTTGGLNPHFVENKWNVINNNASSTANVTNNVIGGTGINAAQIFQGGDYGTTLGGVPTHLLSPVFTGNITLCGYNGYGTTLPSGIFIDGDTSNSTYPANLSILFRNNTTCSTGNQNNGVGGCNGCNVTPGGAGFHTSVSAVGTVTSIDSNIWLSFVPGGSYIAEVESPQNFVSGTSGPSNSANAFGYVGGNYGMNASTFVQQWPTLTFVQTSGTDKSSSATPVFAENNRSPVFFDSEYLTPQGLLNVASYSATPWTTSATYTYGQVVSWSDSGAWNGKTSYWRCIAVAPFSCNTTPSTAALNEPIYAFDSANPWEADAPYWELAYLQWMRGQVFNNVIYDAQCAGLLYVTCPTSPTSHTYITGLLNAWLRAGYASMDTYVWNACSTNTGAITDCGAMPLKPHQHVAAVATTN